jgi:hypothetical protein
MRLRRFIISSLSVMLVSLGMELWVVYGNITHTMINLILGCIDMVVLWPITIFIQLMLHLHRNPPSVIYWWLLWFATGLFWGFIIELFFMLRARKKPNSTL